MLLAFSIVCLLAAYFEVSSTGDEMRILVFIILSGVFFVMWGL